MDKSLIATIVFLVIAAIFISGCTSMSSSPAPSATPVATDTKFDRLLLSPGESLPGLNQRVNGPLQASEITATMRYYGVLDAYRAIYTDKTPVTDKSVIMEQDIMVFPGSNATAMLEEYQNSLTGIKSKTTIALPLPDPNLGERSFAVKISTSDLTGAEKNHYVFGFVQSGIFEVISMDGTPETYPDMVRVAQRAAEKARSYQ